MFRPKSKIGRNVPAINIINKFIVSLKWRILIKLISIFPRKVGVEAQVKKTLKAGIPVLLFYGDTDTVCNFMLGAKFAASLGLPVRIILPEIIKTNFAVERGGKTMDFQRPIGRFQNDLWGRIDIYNRQVYEKK